ncbi:microsomal glutathione S-transferase 1-like [Cydia strobilella]|uniref:microsomal glutathione S-transferase 1-like n=1 Tax=Cydia strobilella TaxID=1100964 RepID=UPI00300740DA
MVLGMPVIGKMLACQGEGRRVNVGDLKQLTPFWLIAAFYTTTSPDVTTAICLFRMFVATKFMSLLGMMTPTPRCLEEASFAMSIAITSYMGFMVVYAYKDAF